MMYYEGMHTVSMFEAREKIDDHDVLRTKYITLGVSLSEG